MKLEASSRPATEKVQFLWRESVISHGADETTEATVAPNPNRTKSNGSAQHNSVPNEVNSARYPRMPLPRLPCMGPPAAMIQAERNIVTERRAKAMDKVKAMA